MKTTPITPPPITQGATLAVVAPASSPTKAELDAAVAGLEAAGYRVKTYRPLCDPVGYLSGTDEQRAAELMTAFADSEADAVLAARGGYGVGRLLDRLDYGEIRRRPKWFAGYSDLTALHVALDSRAGLVSLHSPNAVDGLTGGGKLDAASVSAFWRAVASAPFTVAADSASNARTIAGGSAVGRLIGGNLAVFTSLVGGAFDPVTDGRVLFLEDVGEAPYRVDRLLCQLRLAGKLEKVAGVLLGHFTDCNADPGTPSLTLDEVFDEYFGALGVPVLAGFPAGHALPNRTLPHGAVVELDADRQTLAVLGGDESRCV